MKKWTIPLLLTAFILMSCNLPFTLQWKTPTPMVVTATPDSSPEVVIVTATSEPTQQLPTATSAPQFSGTPYNLGGITMTLPQCLASGASGVVVPENNPGPDAAYFEYSPEYRKITLSGYPLSGKFWEPQIMVYPVARFVELIPDLADTVNEMKQDLAAKPADYTRGIPLLPIQNAAQIFHAQINYVDFQNGEGVGFLTEYAQYYAPVDNIDLFYAFEGLTADGKYWVSMFLPVNAPYLQALSDDPAVPADGIAAPSMMDANAEDEFTAYYQAMVQKLNSTPVDTFTPSLACINQFIQSLTVGD